MVRYDIDIKVGFSMFSLSLSLVIMIRYDIDKKVGLSMFSFSISSYYGKVRYT